MKKVLLVGTLLLMGMLFLSSCNEGRIFYLEPAPVIRWDSPDESYSLKVGTSLILSPIVLYDTDAQYQWLMNGQTVGTDKTYEFHAVEPGTFRLTFKVIREDISVERPVTLHVFDKKPPVIFLAVPPDGFTVATGDTLLLNPVIEHEENTRILWEIDGQEAGRERTCIFYRETAGSYRVSLLAENEDGSDNLLFAVHVKNSEDIPPEEDPDIDPPSDKYYRPADSQSSADWDRVYHYTPAPGQFINDRQTAGFSGESTPEEAVLY
ncbi:MAG: PKD-like domain-containing protein, partial [Bacteroidales bacterium]